MFAHQISIAFVDLMSIWWKNIVYFCKTKVKTLFITNGKNVLDSFQNLDKGLSKYLFHPAFV